MDAPGRMAGKWETVTVCALRETQEEAWVEVDDLKPYVLANLPFINSSCSNVMCAPRCTAGKKSYFIAKAAGLEQN